MRRQRCGAVGVMRGLLAAATHRPRQGRMGWTASSGSKPCKSRLRALDKAHHAKADAPVLPADQRHRKVPSCHAVQQRCLLDGAAICAASACTVQRLTTAEALTMLLFQGCTSLASSVGL